MFEALKKTVMPDSTPRKRKAGADASPNSLKKSKKSAPAPRLSSEPASEATRFEAYVVPSNYRPKKGEMLKSFQEIAENQTLVSSASDFFKNGSKVCFKNWSEWDSMSRYRSAVYLGTSFIVGDDVLVKQDESNDKDARLAPQLRGSWVARIIEIRAADQENVHILVNWYNRPEDLTTSTKRQPHHGMNEVIATNDVDIISPTSLAGKIDIEHWIESEESAPQDRTVFWRQCAAVEEPGKPKFSKLQLSCVCRKPTNVDNTLIQCDSCNTWQHDECLIKALAKSEGVGEKKWKRVAGQDQDDGVQDILPNAFRLTPPKGKPWTVELRGEDAMFVSKDKTGGLWEQNIPCLQCGKWLK